MGAAWITKTYWNYKLVVVNAWVDIPDEYEIEAQAHSYLHQSNAENKTKSVGRGMWGPLVDKVGKKDGKLNGKIEGQEDISLASIDEKEQSVLSKDSISIDNSGSIVVR